MSVILRIIHLVDKPSEPKIGNLNRIPLKKNILRLDISMDNIVFIKVVKGLTNLLQNLNSLDFTKLSLFAIKVVLQVILT